jgi:hypothetical protein
MAYVPSNQIIFTNKAQYRMKYHKLYENEILLTFNSPDSTHKASSFYDPSVYENTKDFGQYIVHIIYRWEQKDKKWLLITCWKAWKQKRWYRPITWWFAHILGR